MTEEEGGKGAKESQIETLTVTVLQASTMLVGVIIINRINSREFIFVSESKAANKNENRKMKTVLGNDVCVKELLI